MHTIIDHALAQARAFAKPGDRVPVARYADAASFKRLRPADALSYEQHCEIVNATVEALKKAGFCAYAVTINEEEYRKWLGDGLNTEEQRAYFVASRLEGKDDH